MISRHDSKTLTLSRANTIVGIPCRKSVSKKIIPQKLLDASAALLIINCIITTTAVKADKRLLLKSKSSFWKSSTHKQQNGLAVASPFSATGAAASQGKETLKIPLEAFILPALSLPKGNTRQDTASHDYTSIQTPGLPNLFSAERLSLPKLGEPSRRKDKLQGRQIPAVKRNTWRDRPLHELPVIIEPMMFDLIRPLHSQQGEWEFNTLGFFPLSPETEFAWEPEFEYAIGDGFAVELELPFVNKELEYLKFTTQYTLGTGLNNKLIHAIQGIYEYGLDGGISVPTGLWIVGVRLSRTWSFIGMSGLRSFISPQQGIQRTELLKNAALYADINETWNVGIEANIEQDFSGPTHAVLIPQAHWHITDLIELRFGVGVDISPDQTVPLGAFRVIYSPH
jgi:hypothetical protein